MTNQSKIKFFILCCYAVLFSCQSNKLALEKMRQERITLPNGWRLTPYHEKTLQLGDLPLQIAVSPTQKYFAITNNGVANQYIQLFDAKKQIEIAQIDIPKAWYGLAFNKAENQIYACGGNDNKVFIYDILNGKLTNAGEIKLGEPWPTEKICPTGIAMDEDNNHLFCVTKEDNALYICNLKDKKVEKKIMLGSEAYAVAFNAELQEIYITLWGAKKVLVFDNNQFNSTLSH
jgi:DNA-binding beta-propeller fold protein YncE